MGREWQIGDPVDYTTDGWMDAQNWTGDHYIEEDDSESSSPDYKNEEYSKKAWDLYNDFKDEEALYYINLALDLYDRSSRDWNRKAIILESLKRYDESEKSYDRSLQLHQSQVVSDNKARMLSKWAMNLLEKSKKLPNGLNMLYEAREKILKAIKLISRKNNEDDFNRFIWNRDSINFYIDYEKQFQKNLETLKTHDKSEFFTITGTKFYKYSKKLVPGRSLKLVKEPDNEFDSDAIAVFLDDEKVGYVANKDYTKCELTSSASELQSKISDTAQAQYSFVLSRYSSIEFDIGRIVK